MMETEYKIVLSILIPFIICFYFYALYRLKKSEKGRGFIGWTISKDKTAQEKK